MSDLTNKQPAQPLVSVIIPVFNAQEYLRGCVESVQLQTYQNVEIICIDDGSTDQSPQILAEASAADPRIKVFTQENQGPGVARNTGLDHAQGAYLLFLDADDYYRRELIEHTLDCALEHNAQIVAFNYTVFNQRAGCEYDPEWTLVASRYPQGQTFDWHANPEPLFFTFENLPWNKMFEAEFIRQNNIRYFETYLTEDLMFSGSALVWAKRIATLDERLLVRREDIGTNIMAGKDKHPFDFINAFAAFREKIAQRADFAQLEPAYRYWAASGLTYNLLTLNQPDTFNAVFDNLHESGLARMGLDAEKVKNPFDNQVIDYIKAGKKLDLLFYATRFKADEASLTQFKLGETQQRAEKDIARVQHELDDMTAWRDGLQRDHDDLWAQYNALAEERNQLTDERNQLRAQYESLQNSAEQRVGQAICKLPRAIQRATKK
jgi:glycosyltransferase EpsH